MHLYSEGRQGPEVGTRPLQLESHGFGVVLLLLPVLGL